MRHPVTGPPSDSGSSNWSDWVEWANHLTEGLPPLGVAALAETTADIQKTTALPGAVAAGHVIAEMLAAIISDPELALTPTQAATFTRIVFRYLGGAKTCDTP